MIPPTIDPEVNSSAERRIFHWLEKLEGDYIALHSLGIARHIDNLFGEIDFVIICHEGILCIEVKGGRVSRRDGIWYFTNRFGQENAKHKGPFEQAQGNMQSLRQYLVKRLGKTDAITRCQYACCVMTPDCSIDVRGEDVVKDILFDEHNSEADIISFFHRSFEYWRDLCKNKHGFIGGQLSKADIQRVVTILRGDFNFVPALSVMVKRVDDALLSVTEEQYVIMDGFDEDERMMIQGAAGTGKTLLALEQCRRLSSVGKKVLYLCYNRAIAAFIRKALEKEDSNFEVANLHSLMNQYVKVPEQIEDSEAFSEAISEQFIAFTDSEEWDKDLNTYDAVIIDEGQDLMTTYFYMCINPLIRGGFAEGIWSIYYDANQNIYNKNKEFQEILTQLRKDATGKYNLTTNCRNTRQIATANKFISNIKQAKTLKTNGNNVEYIGYASINEERRQLIKVIRNLRSQGIALNDIVILSPYRIDNPKSCLYEYQLPADIGRLRMNQVGTFMEDGYLNVFTIHSFKGLESRIVVLIDIDAFKNPDRRLLNYVAISRCKALLYLLYNKNAEDERQEMMMSGIMMK